MRLAAIILVSVVAASGSAEVLYLDSIGSNFLFRGGMPPFTPGGELDYKGLVASIQAAAKAAGVTLPPQPWYIADISLIQLGNCGDDRKNLQIEAAYWASHPKQGKLVYWQTDGEDLDPTDPSIASMRDSLISSLDSWLPDQLPRRVDQLHTWLRKGMPPNRLPLILYVHCEGGCDRTGELSGAYAMRYLGRTWTQINDMNIGPCGDRTFGCRNFYAARWYCYALAAKTGRKLGCDAPSCCSGPPVSCPGPWPPPKSCGPVPCAN